MQNFKKKNLLRLSYGKLYLNLNFKQKINKIPKKLKNKNYFLIKKTSFLDNFYLLNLIAPFEFNEKNKIFFSNTTFLNKKLCLKVDSLKNTQKKLNVKIKKIEVKELFACKLKIVTKLKFFNCTNFNFNSWNFSNKITRLNFNLYFFNFFFKDWFSINTALNLKKINNTTFMNSFKFHEEYFFFRWLDKIKKSSLVYNDISVLLRVNSYPINFLDFFNEAINLKLDEFNLNSFSLIFSDYYSEILKKIKSSEHECYFFKSKKFKALKKKKKKKWC